MRSLTLIKIITCVLLIVGSCLGFRQLVPSGLGGAKHIMPYLCFSYDRGAFKSPGGTSQVRIVSNDGGATHSGHFPSWVIVDHWWGKEVVAKGYLESSQGPVPLVWLDETSFTINFYKERHGDETETIKINLQ